ncbi:MAG: PEP-CTERM sorting domain-containing protein [Gemmatimonas sp.]
MKRRVTLAATALLAMLASRAEAQYNPFGVQTNVAVSTVTTGGWTQCYAATMSVFIGFNAENVLNVCTQNEIMMAGRTTGSSTLLLLASGNRAEVIQDTGITDTFTHAVNGSAWYYASNFSWGFDILGGAVQKSECDTSDGAFSMCLHTVNSAGGYRIGNATELNTSVDYEKVFYQRTVGGATVAPEPSSVALMAVGLLALGGVARRRTRRA